MDYSQLKNIVSVKSFNIIQNLINKPTLDLYMTNFVNADDSVNTIDDPYSNDVLDMTNITQDDLVFIKTVDCIYTYDKVVLTQNDSNLGSIYSLMIYMRSDDVPPDILNSKNSVVVRINGIDYIASEFQNAYNIIVQANLNR